MKKNLRVEFCIMTLVFLMCLHSCEEVKKQTELLPERKMEMRYNPENEPYYNIRTKRYEGAWFTINYPSDFIVRNSMRSLTSVEGFDSAFFTSPDGLVEFYVFSPQSDGRPSDIEIRPQSEFLIDSDIREFKDKTEILYTIAAKDGSYKRSYREVKQYGGSMNWVLGIKYTSKRAYQKYQQAYVRFKKSLNQFADGDFGC
ncbi:MAG: hypothetical protein ACO3AW_09105 [Chitinophagaceae bacterium]